MIDSEGFRPNVGIILANDAGQVLWAKRIGHNAWQFPQGGIQYGESPEDALYRELYEEVGLLPEHVERIITRAWDKTPNDRPSFADIVTDIQGSLQVPGVTLSNNNGPPSNTKYEQPSL